MKYKVTVPYWFTLTAIVEAENEEQALLEFDKVSTLDCSENYQGLLDSYEIEIKERTK